jgi:hypothetical protein
MQPRQAETPPHRSECVAQSEQFEENSSWSWQLPPMNVSTPLPFQHFYRFSIFTVSAFLPFQHFYRFSIFTVSALKL